MLFRSARARFIPLTPEQDPLFKDQQQKDPDEFFLGAIEQACRGASTNRAKPILLSQPDANEIAAGGEPRLTAVMRKVSESLGAPLVDVGADLKPFGTSIFLEGDPVHLTKAGNEIIAKRLVEAFAKFPPPNP